MAIKSKRRTDKNEKNALKINGKDWLKIGNVWVKKNEKDWIKHSSSDSEKGRDHFINEKDWVKIEKIHLKKKKKG